MLDKHIFMMKLDQNNLKIKRNMYSKSLIISCRNFDFKRLQKKNALIQNIFLCISFSVSCIVKKEIRNCYDKFCWIKKEQIANYNINQIFNMSSTPVLLKK